MLRFSNRSGAIVTTTTRTKRGLRIASVASVLAAAAAVQAARAQGQPDAVSVDVSECVKLTTPEERLACFDKQVEGSRAAPGAASAPAASSRPAPANNSSGGGGQPRQSDPADIHASVTGLRETVPNAYLVTLDNGQVWRQTVPKSYPLREGDPVRLYYSRWRAYRLTNDRLKGFIQVERVQ
jgi:hypothetical protein